MLQKEKAPRPECERPWGKVPAVARASAAGWESEGRRTAQQEKALRKEGPARWAGRSFEAACLENVADQGLGETLKKRQAASRGLPRWLVGAQFYWVGAQ